MSSPSPTATTRGPPWARRPSPPTNLAASVTTDASATTNVPTTEVSASPPSTAAAVPGSASGTDECGAASVPDGAANVQSITGDIDGDHVDDAITLYAVDHEWHVHATSSVTGKASDAVLDLALGESIEVATVSLADVDVPSAVMVTAEGPNDLGIDANFTFLTLNRGYCVEQWIYRNAEEVDEPFEWVALQEPGHVTGMICEGSSPRGPTDSSTASRTPTARGVSSTASSPTTSREPRSRSRRTTPSPTPAISPRIYGSIVGCG